MPEISRRQFMAATGVAAACLLCPTCATFAADAKPLDVGTTKDYDKDGAFDKFAQSDRIFIVRQNGQIYAMPAVCTHEGKKLVVAPDDPTQLLCPTHKGRFTLDGKVSKKPPKRSLARLGISVNDAGHILVDPSKRFTEDQWTDPGSFVKVP